MTQQQLFDKVRALLEPTGFLMRLQGNWRFGHVQFNVRKFDIFAYAFTYDNLVEEVAGTLAYLKECVEEHGEEVEEREFDFLYTLQAILETFPDVERNTDVNYTFDQPLFDFLKETLAAENIELLCIDQEDDKQHSRVFFEAKFPNLHFRVFPIFGRCFTPEGVESEVYMTGQDREWLESGDTPEFEIALRSIERAVQQYRQKLLLDEATKLVANPNLNL